MGKIIFVQMKICSVVALFIGAACADDFMYVNTTTELALAGGSKVGGSNTGSVCGDPKSRWKQNSNSWNVYKNTLQSQGIYTDADYKTSWDTMYSAEAPPKASQVSYYKKKVLGYWRPKEFLKGKNPSLLGSLGDYKPSGISQGSLSDCWFLAGATAIAEDPSRLKHVIHQNSRSKYNWQGIFRYYFWSYDAWVPINIDDKLPGKNMYSNSDCCQKPFASDKSKFGAWWMPLLEKAYTKLNGNYDRIEWGSGYESLRQLTAMPVFYYKHKKINSVSEMYNLFGQMAKRNYPMVVACCDVSGNAPDGLVNNHAYTLLDVTVLQGTKLAKIRNPWGSEGYNGAWSDKDPVWTPALLKQAGHKKDMKDGVFFMPFQQFVSVPYFRSTTAAVYENWAKTSVYHVNQQKKQMYVRVTIPTRQSVYFTFEGQNPRFNKNCKKDNTYINVFFFKGTRYPGQGKELLPIAYMGKSLYHVTVGKPGVEWDAGTYSLLVADWNYKAGTTTNYSLTVYQSNPNKVSISW